MVCLTAKIIKVIKFLLKETFYLQTKQQRGTKRQTYIVLKVKMADINPTVQKITLNLNRLNNPLKSKWLLPWDGCIVGGGGEGRG